MRNVLKKIKPRHVYYVQENCIIMNNLNQLQPEYSIQNNVHKLSLKLMVICLLVKKNDNFPHYVQFYVGIFHYYERQFSKCQPARQKYPQRKLGAFFNEWKR